MAEVKIGDTLRNNDPRRSGEEVKVIAVVNGPVADLRVIPLFAVYQGKTRKCRIHFGRIHNDGKSRHQGWSVVPVATAV